MTISGTLHHILHLTLHWWHRTKRAEMRKNALFESPASISTPLGVASPYRRVDVNASLEDGIARARKRHYVGGKCKRVDE